MEIEAVTLDAARVLSTLSESLRLSGIQVESSGEALIISERAAAISLRIESNTVLWLRAEFGVLPQTGRSRWCARLLSANLFSERSGGGVFALDETGRIHLQRRLCLLGGVDYNSLTATVGRFVAGAAGFRAVVDPSGAMRPGATSR
jgi:hypothetical protein